MRLSKTPALRASLRPAFRQAHHIQPVQARLASASSGPGGEVGDKGPAKGYNKDGTNPNKNLIYAGLGALGLGGVYAMFMAKPDKVAEKAKSSSPAAR
ncbi:uncharacterized protein B0H64DRAFT_446430 [Chaetomium fimeti]|uniref:Uncharacterized protein n=1 Tax=Chaetomium fimeti TaxID=1854472 RepID=A0AAE0H7B2_9PEZI|nr:hypothetical protein B0H64DRAFT_446430 [Chaetomium fimeti]